MTQGPGGMPTPGTYRAGVQEGEEDKGQKEGREQGPQPREDKAPTQENSVPCDSVTHSYLLLNPGRPESLFL